MQAIYFDDSRSRPELREVPDPTPSRNGVVVRVEATGLCRSAVHGWLGHDDGISLPHVPGIWRLHSTNHRPESKDS